MLDCCVNCSRTVNTVAEPFCYDVHDVCLCKECREQALAEDRPHTNTVRYRRDQQMLLDNRTGLAEGVVSLQRYGNKYTGQWATTGNRISVYWNMKEDSALLGMFDKEPETLARILLSDMVNRELTKHDAAAKRKQLP